MAKDKKQDKEKKVSQKWKKYTIEGDHAKPGKSCPKCGPGIFLAEHKDRVACGKCGYMEKKSSAPAVPKEVAPKAKPEVKVLTESPAPATAPTEATPAVPKEEVKE